MAYFPVNVLDNAIKALPTIKAISNTPIATFDTDIADRLVNLQVAVTATQSGSGTPSPSNPRSISGWSNCNLSVNGTTHTINFGQTVYGGSLDVITGKLTITHGYALLGNLSWVYDGSRFQTLSLINDIKKPASGRSDDGVLCSNYVASVSGTNETFFVYQTGDLYFYDTSYSNANDFKTGNATTQLVYTLATPTTIQLSSEEVASIVGNNNIYADTGDIIELKFVLSVGKAIS